MEICNGSSVAGVFTKNKARSDTINISEKNLKKCNPKYIIVNSGNANAGTGKKGFNDIIKYTKSLANLVDCKIDDILVFSTGVIGEKLALNNIIKSIPILNNNLSETGWDSFSKAILTTDTSSKKISKTIILSDLSSEVILISKSADFKNEAAWLNSVFEISFTLLFVEKKPSLRICFAGFGIMLLLLIRKI